MRNARILCCRLLPLLRLCRLLWVRSSFGGMSRPKSMGRLAEDLEALLDAMAQKEAPSSAPPFWKEPWAKVVLGIACGLLLLLFLLLLGQLG